MGLLEIILFVAAVVYSGWYYVSYGQVSMVALVMAGLLFCVLAYDASRDAKREKLDNDMADFEWLKLRQDRQKEDPAVLLEKLGELKNKGIITEEEFNSKKAEILARM